MKRSNSESRRAGFTNAGLEINQPSYNSNSLGADDGTVNSNGAMAGFGADNIGMSAANNGSNATIATAILTGPNAGTLTGGTGRFAGDSAGATTANGTANGASESLSASAQVLEAQPAPPLNSSENNFDSGLDHHQRNNNQHIARQSQTDVPSVGFSTHRQNSNSHKPPAYRFADLTIVPSSLSHTSHSHRVAPSSNRASDDSVALSTASGYFVPRDQSNETASRSASLPRSALASSTATAIQDTPSRPAPFRSSTFDIPSSPLPFSPAEQLKRSTSYPVAEPLELSVTSAGSHSRRGSTARVSFDFAASDDPPSTLRAQRAQAEAEAEAIADDAIDSELPTLVESESGQRELLLSKRHSQSSPPPDGKRVCRPPVSYKPPANAPSAASTPIRVAPIRGFRSSISRRSSGASRRSQNFDMNFTPRPYDLGTDTSDTNDNNFDRTLRALEGRQSQDASQIDSQISTKRENTDGDDGGDLFLRIAREEVSRRTNDGNSSETQNSVPRFMRSAHRRPMSTTVAAVPTSPTFPSRRLSEQQDSGRFAYEDDRASEVMRPSPNRVQLQDKAASVHPADDVHRSSRTSNSGSLRPSPIAARQHQFNFSDPDSPNFSHSRRHSSVNDQTTPPITRSVFKFTPQAKSYNSSPLVKSFDFGKQGNQDGTQGVEGTDSTSSTNAPSTVWDELDELKSRLHRLELTGKLPATSGAAVSKASDERPPTATTTMTTMSSSPKRSNAQITETGSTTSSQREATQREAYPILVSALAKTRAFLNPEVYRALESAANDAMVLSSLLGVPGQPGPISSGASAIGSGTNVTDRQLRRKADGVCRSLTELCVALGEDVSQNRSAPVEPVRSQQTYHTDAPKTPTVAKTYNGLTSGRRPSVQVDTHQAQPVQRVITSPTSRPFSKFEERRQTLLNGFTSPRNSGNLNATSPQQDSSANRRSSLLITRTRRAGTEEPEDTREQGTKSSLFRTRARTEEPEDTSGRKTSILRSRRGTTGEGEDETSRFGAPLRAYTEVASSRGPGREYTEIATSRGPARDYTSRTQGRIYGQTREQREQRDQSEKREVQTHTTESRLPQASALPRRRFGSSNVGGVSLSGAPSALPTSTRKYFDRSSTSNDRDRHGVTSPVDRYPEDRNRRPMSLGGNLTLNRSGSLSSRRQERENNVTMASTTANSGNYR